MTFSPVPPPQCRRSATKRARNTHERSAARGQGTSDVLDRRAAGWWLIATLLAIFPANVNMAVNAGRFKAIPAWALWARLPVQALLIAWAHRAAVKNV